MKRIVCIFLFAGVMLAAGTVSWGAGIPDEIPKIVKVVDEKSCIYVQLSKASMDVCYDVTGNVVELRNVSRPLSDVELPSNDLVIKKPEKILFSLPGLTKVRSITSRHNNVIRPPNNSLL